MPCIYAAKVEIIPPPPDLTFRQFRSHFFLSPLFFGGLLAAGTEMWKCVILLQHRVSQKPVEKVASIVLARGNTPWKTHTLIHGRGCQACHLQDQGELTYPDGMLVLCFCCLPLLRRCSVVNFLCLAWNGRLLRSSARGWKCFDSFVALSDLLWWSEYAFRQCLMKFNQEVQTETLTISTFACHTCCGSDGSRKAFSKSMVHIEKQIKRTGESEYHYHYDMIARVQLRGQPSQQQELSKMQNYLVIY